MPYKVNYDTSTSTPPEEPSFLQKWGGTGVRLGAGVLSTLAQGADVFGGLGIPLAGAIGAGGEALAEKVEGSPISYPRIGMEGAISSVPLGWIFGGGIAGAAAKNAAYSGAGTVGRQVAAGENPLDTSNMKSTALNTGLGALLGGGIAKWHGPGVIAPDVEPPPTPVEPPLNISTDYGQRTFHSPIPQIKAARTPINAKDISTFQGNLEAGLEKKLSGGPDISDMVGDLDSGINNASQQGAQRRALNFRADTNATKLEQQADAAYYKQQQAEVDAEGNPLDQADKTLLNAKRSMGSTPPVQPPTPPAANPDLMDQYLASVEGPTKR
jgi:hypothetical protein